MPVRLNLHVQNLVFHYTRAALGAKELDIHSRTKKTEAQTFLRLGVLIESRGYRLQLIWLRLPLQLVDDKLDPDLEVLMVKVNYVGNWTWRKHLRVVIRMA